ncbi:MAG: hypothetical protein NVS3B20_21490 [Polyangiales bacterium]
MDEKSATEQAAEQIVNELGLSAGFMISLRILQSIAQRSPPSPDLVATFEQALKSLERFAQAAGLGDREPASPVN